MNLDDLHVIQRSTSGSAATLIGQQSDFTEVISAGEIRQHQLPTGMIFTDFDEPNPDQIEAICRIALTADYLARSKALQFDPVPKVIDEVLCK